MRVTVHYHRTHKTIECDQVFRRENGTIVLARYGSEIAVFGPGFEGYIEIESEHQDRGS